MAVTAIYGSAAVVATNTANIQPGAGEEYNIVLRILAGGTGDYDVIKLELAGNGVEVPLALDHNDGAFLFQIRLILTNTNYLTIHNDGASTLQYQYTGYKKT